MRLKTLAVKALVCFTFAVCLVGVIFCIAYKVIYPTKSNSKAHRYEGPTQQPTTAIEQSYPEPDREVSSHEQGYAAKWTEPITILTALLVFGVGVTNWIYYGQLKEMRKTVALVGAQLQLMDEQAKQSEQALDLSLAEVKTLGQQAEAALIQSKLMAESLAETRKMVDQNERAVKASEDSAKTAREAFYVGQAPYFGISRMAWLDFDVGHSPQLVMEFVNGGKTPAWLFYALPTVVFGDSPEEGDHWNLMPARDDIVNSFIPSDKSAEIKFVNNAFRYTKEMHDRVEAESAYLFVVVTLNYRDFRKRDHRRVLKYVWDRRTWVFSDYETTNEAQADEGGQNAN